LEVAVAGRLDNLVAAVTGGGQGIGRAIALRLASEGAHLVIADINESTAQQVAGEVADLGRQSLALHTDVSSKTECEQMVERVTGEFGRLDVMYCNAGIVQVKPLFEMSEKDWDQMFAVNCKGVFFTLQAAARQMLRQDRPRPGGPRGKIVNTASIAGRYGANPTSPLLSHYRASKAAVISITQSAAQTLAPDVTVNAICPGVVETDMWRTIDEQWAEAEGLEIGEAWRRRTAPIPMGRPQTPEDITGLAAFLASADSDYMTGQSINVEGGLIMS
jgi:meso-butanediol dehydrogenase / (S,S)-butanediol dehydrogenase / diacetyl reductase